MTYSVILFVPRKQGLSLDAFQQHWETSHVPLLKSLVGYDFPLSHTRHYIERELAHCPDPAADIIFGAPGVFPYDGVAVLTFADKGHWNRFLEKLDAEEAKRAHREDLERFVDVEGLKGVVVGGGTKATGRDGGNVGWRFVGSL